MMAYGMLFGFTAGLGQLDHMAEFVTATGLSSDPGLADPYMRSSVEQGDPSVRAERTNDVVLGQALLYACLHGTMVEQMASWLEASTFDGPTLRDN